ncbi:hypothetical protein BVC80_1835g484 [Macleaya cordata]|uniref:Uncharacterized protein n=1 Tax=Macleaya cordata TaxID=56857 RepID=A0A200R5S1_MACCD|nr:hypothetical protein BVC80_1835g484 [Macleaya cordata]
MAATILLSQDWFLKTANSSLVKKHKPPSSHHCHHHHCKNCRNLKSIQSGRRGSRRHPKKRCSLLLEEKKEEAHEEKGGGGNRCTTTTTTTNTPTATNVVKFNPSRNLIAGQVKILKRGEKLPNNKDDVGTDHRDHHYHNKKLVQQQQQQQQHGDDLVFPSSSSKAPLGMEPDEMVPKLTDLRRKSFDNGGIDTFSGPTFFSSPSPNFLPLPSGLFSKKDDNNSIVMSGGSNADVPPENSNNDFATKGLYRLLHLDLRGW